MTIGGLNAGMWAGNTVMPAIRGFQYFDCLSIWAAYGVSPVLTNDDGLHIGV